ncbi:hypothetical protein IRP63_15160 (plasmid) [Clostridium botulinum]|uniref:Uncharacterized protein n=1 Tax=Clostridium botulinum C/D str. DC5 TaxID=1443128 RepID=A0A0A0IF43_CLOBO|nr:hypothetical protein [Clostridium botulinum]KEI00118.1 hypothetical protein Z952_14130 [Clostridium botulinum C/D str. BKT75002]KEI06008.1 hypothetical protein Z954_14300 [Clostridium botulinum C/D str. BKT2873]KGM92958.1 hypothetical protein Z956_12950 [Clostridium botulinum D str. CCUG 7971]KGM98906.1 hypothetical protein Z955_09845 [Clostridium botulinum C/D str. DC5]KOC50121.1 hypothetical protein ADU88_03630 [Clostridium botulinum]
MKKIINIFIALSLFIMAVLIFTYDVIIGGDIPVNIRFDEVIKFSIISFIYIILQLIYIIKNKHNPLILNLIFSVCLTFIWTMCFMNNLTYRYHKYATLTGGIGFFSTIFILVMYILAFKKKYFIKIQDNK